MPNPPEKAVQQNADQYISVPEKQPPADCRKETETAQGIDGGIKSATKSAGKTGAPDKTVRDSEIRLSYFAAKHLLLLQMTTSQSNA